MQTSIAGAGVAGGARASGIQVMRPPELRRRHERVRAAAAIEVVRPDGSRLSARVQDLSAGGLSFLASEYPFRPGSLLRGYLSIQAGSLAVAIPVTLQVRYRIPQSGRAGCSFQGLDMQGAVLLRRLVTSVRERHAVDVAGLLPRAQSGWLEIPRHRPRHRPAAGAGQRSSGLAVMIFLLIIAGAAYLMLPLSEDFFARAGERAASFIGELISGY
jgi:hypothetical protein